MTVSISEGLHLTDRDAGRFARAMLDDIEAFNRRANAAIGVVMSGTKGSSMGNRISQQRVFHRIAKAMGPTFLAGTLGTGKKARFAFHYMTFLREGPGLVLLHVTMNGRQAAEEDDILQVRVLMKFTQHSLQRLIQRAGVREADDYVPILRGLATPSLAIALAAKNSIPCGQWPLPVRIGDEQFVVVVKTPEDDPIPTAMTVYPGAWRDYPEMTDLQHRLAEFDPLRVSAGSIACITDAFNAAARLFNRERTYSR